MIISNFTKQKLNNFFRYFHFYKKSQMTILLLIIENLNSFINTTIFINYDKRVQNLIHIVTI